MKDLQQYTGCLLGGAAGDALGYAVEFTSAKEIFRRYGPEGIRSYALRDGLALISDDTQMTMFTAAGLLACDAREGDEAARKAYAQSIASAYLDWYQTQRCHGPVPAKGTGGWLMDVAALYSPRAPGNTCMSALSAGGKGTIANPANHSKGCGGVMRAAPVGLYFAGRPESIAFSDEVGADAGAVTHGHPLGWLPSAMLAHIVRRIVENGDTIFEAVTDALDSMEGTFAGVAHWGVLRALIEKAIHLAEGDLEDLQAIQALGEGWVGDEAIAIAVYCALRHRDNFEACLAAAVNHSGDSDSTGAIAGNILGASLGEQGIPEKFLTNLELQAELRRLAQELFYTSNIQTA